MRLRQKTFGAVSFPDDSWLPVLASTADRRHNTSNTTIRLWGLADLMVRFSSNQSQIQIRDSASDDVNENCLVKNTDEISDANQHSNRR